MKRYTFQELLERGAREFQELPVFIQLDKLSYSYCEFYGAVKHLACKLQAAGFQKNDKIAILAENSLHWPLAYFAINRIGAIAVPVLPDFADKEIDQILKHSEASALFHSAKQAGRLNRLSAIQDLALIQLENFSFSQPEAGIVHENKKQNFVKLENPENKDFCTETAEDDVASIIYTSGTTGNSKGVMLSQKNMVWNAVISSKIPRLDKGVRFLSVLPLAHTYEFTIGTLVAFYLGGSVSYLNGPPSASLLLPALAKVRPHAMLSVPLLIEKIYYGSVKPKFSKPGLLKNLYKIKLLRKILNKAAGKKLMKTFGGRMSFFGIGGAPLNHEVENFLREASFPYAIGYGLTETSPLIAGCHPSLTRPQSTGPVIDELQIKITEDKNSEILVKSPGVMLGYYKNEEETSKVLDNEGWLHTGDSGALEDGYLYIKGRIKNVIVGPSGENIYPENIEDIISQNDFVEEALVMHKEGKGLVALVKLNYENIQKQIHDLATDISKLHEMVGPILDNLRKQINSHLSSFSRIAEIIEQNEPFVKTPTKKIKRYLYSV